MGKSLLAEDIPRIQGLILGPLFLEHLGLTLHVTGFHVLFAHFDECFEVGQAAT